MNRRNFLTLSAAVAALGLSGCGSSTEDSSFGSTTGDSGSSQTISAQQIQGRIAPELVFADAQIGSAFGPSIISGDTFTTSISTNSVAVLALGDSSGKMRAFTLTFPGDPPVFSAENTALAVVFLEPGRRQLRPQDARNQIAAIRASAAFAPLVQLLLANASTPLDTLARETSYYNALQALLTSLGNPFTSQLPQAAPLDGGAVRFTNPSPRFLAVRRTDAQGTRTLPDFIPAYGTLVDRGDGKTLPTSYSLEGLGPSDTLPADTSLIESTYWPTLFFNFYIPVLEMAAGRPITTEEGLQLMRTLPTPDFDPRVDLASQSALGAALSEDLQNVDANMVDAFQAQIENVLITQGFKAGLTFATIGLLAYTKANRDPHDKPIGTPVSLFFVELSLLFLPTLFAVAGLTLFGEPS